MQTIERTKYGRIRNAPINVVPLRAALVVLICGIALRLELSHIIVDQRNFSCQAARTGLAIQEQNYERKYHHYVVGDEDALQELVRTHMARALPTCRAGGHYSAVANPDGSITIHCSLPEHDHGGGVTRLRYQKHRFPPLRRP